VTNPIYQSPQDRLTQLIDTAIKTVEAEQNSSKSVVMALDYLRDVQAEYLAQIQQSRQSGPFNTDKQG